MNCVRFYTMVPVAPSLIFCTMVP
ncbi:hypothetical protein G994_03162, partial [Escherichia coli UMEA 3718-1]